MVRIGDIHGAGDAFARILQKAGLIDAVAALVGRDGNARPDRRLSRIVAAASGRSSTF